MSTIRRPGFLLLLGSCTAVGLLAVSLLPFGGNALGVHTDGLQYPLHGDSLYVGPARGVSNVMLAARAVVRVAAGMLLCITTQARRCCTKG